MCNCNYPPLLLVDKLVRRLLRPVGFLKSTLTFESKLLKLPPFLIDFNHVLETCAVLYTMPMSPVICAIFTYMSIYLDARANTFPKECLSILNKALLCKWSWRFAIEREAFWNQVIRGKYGEEQGGWCSKEARGVLWKSLRKDWDVYAWVKDVWCSNEGGGSWYRLMTGSWMRFVDFFWPYTGREFNKQWMIG
ncbi:hypothetical protein CK203_045398 [Vitis vinifera]|uniref:Uncharacterized protein n=1 Tax=Vitis vinifera TaxID=29760 RepID=A0A438H9Q4_VITVI|nr:hypothetical protein CK203_045398 [Vitis vinifera]